MNKKHSNTTKYKQAADVTGISDHVHSILYCTTRYISNVSTMKNSISWVTIKNINICMTQCDAEPYNKCHVIMWSAASAVCVFTQFHGAFWSWHFCWTLNIFCTICIYVGAKTLQTPQDFINSNTTKYCFNHQMASSPLWRSVNN